MLRRYESCIGLSLPAIGRWKLEVWFAPPGYKIAPHTHDLEDIKLILLFGHNVRFYRQKKGSNRLETVLARFSNIGRLFNIRAGDLHYFTVSDWPLVFLNIEHWHCKPTSACEDFNLVKENIYADNRS
jgi:hypothetical protein